MKHFLFLALIISAVGCTNPKLQLKIDQVTELQHKVDSSKVVMDSIDIHKVTLFKEYAGAQIDFLEDHPQDSSYREEAKYIDVYLGNFKMLRKLIKNYEPTQAEIEYTQGQLNNLYADLSNGLVADSTYARFYRSEKMATVQIVNTVRKLRDWEIRGVKRHMGMVNQVDSIITSLENLGFR